MFGKEKKSQKEAEPPNERYGYKVHLVNKTCEWTENVNAVKSEEHFCNGKIKANKFFDKFGRLVIAIYNTRWQQIVKVVPLYRPKK